MPNHLHTELHTERHPPNTSSSAAIHIRVAPASVDTASIPEKLQWFSISVGMLVVSWIVANSIPFFHLMMGIVAACTTAPLTFGFPAYFYWHDMRRRARSLRSRRGGGTEAERAATQLPAWEVVALLFMGALTVFLLSFGLVSNLDELAQRWGADGPLFSCRSLLDLHRLAPRTTGNATNVTANQTQVCQWTTGAQPGAH